ncbi:MAG: chromate efflux transporter [Pseudomonadota bacterium]|nr:chromate efflux transporter [Pseudomonadota bacterium]
MSAPQPTFAEACRVWLRIGLLSFGGPAGQIALMHRILVEERRWLPEDRFLHALNFCMLLPGPEAQQLATYSGWMLHGTRGGIVAGSLFVLPGLLVMLLLASAWVLFQGGFWFAGIFFGLKCAVLAIVVQALAKIAKRGLKTRAMWAIAALAFLAIFAFGVPFPVIVVASGVAGWLMARGVPARAAAEPVANPAAGWRHAITVTAVCGALWVAPVLLLVALSGSDSIWPDIAGFFSKMAVLTFGGAYAVLAWVAQQAVETHGWLMPGEMLDGLALAETTPGPLVLVLSFVGHVAAFRNPGALDPLLAAWIGGLLTAWVTFVPCFLWIFLGAPHVERLRGNPRIAGALGAITAAVVGVILNLALWFALHVVFRQVGTLQAGPLALAWPDIASIDPLAAALSVLALAGVFVFRLGLLPLLGAAAAAGLATALI